MCIAKSLPISQNIQQIPTLSLSLSIIAKSRERKDSVREEEEEEEKGSRSWDKKTNTEFVLYCSYS